MKNGMLIWNVLLTAVLGYLLIVQFGSGKTRNTTKSSVKDSLKVNGDFRIAYFEMDSIAANFILVKQLKEEMLKREAVINNELDRMDKSYRKKLNDYQLKAQAQAMTQVESEKATQDLMKTQEDMKNSKMNMDQDYNDFVIRKQDEIKGKIQDFLKEYNKTKNYSYIVSYEQGLFYYKDTAYNITSDVLKGLNEIHKLKKQ